MKNALFYKFNNIINNIIINNIIICVKASFFYKKDELSKLKF